MKHLVDLIVKPLITEKSSEQSEKFNRYGFVVDQKANKRQIKAAIESIYDVKVLSVRTSILPGKVKRAGKSVKKSSKSKRAFVELEKGQKIEFFKGI